MVDVDAIERTANESNFSRREVLLADCVRTIAVEVRRLQSNRSAAIARAALRIRQFTGFTAPYEKDYARVIEEELNR